jgi:hypothetical protein
VCSTLESHYDGTENSRNGRGPQARGF